MDRNIEIIIEDQYWRCCFFAMASPCELLFETKRFTEHQVISLANIAYDEAKRIEYKFSRYRDDNVIFSLNNAAGKSIRVDDETMRMLAYANQLYQLSDGMFDITSGVLRRVWCFDGGDKLPDKNAISKILPLIGWDKIKRNDDMITLPQSMEIDLGGIGKEYAVDRTVKLLRSKTKESFLVNYGGDLYASGSRSDGKPWRVGLDDPANTGKKSLVDFELSRGGVATSGDARRFLFRDGVRYSHILNPRTGWPIKNAPHGVTVIASTCTEAGMLATFSMLKGAKAEAFLQQQKARFWCF